MTVSRRDMLIADTLDRWKQFFLCVFRSWGGGGGCFSTNTASLHNSLVRFALVILLVVCVVCRTASQLFTCVLMTCVLVLSNSQRVIRPEVTLCS